MPYTFKYFYFLGFLALNTTLPLFSPLAHAIPGGIAFDGPVMEGEKIPILLDADKKGSLIKVYSLQVAKFAAYANNCFSASRAKALTPLALYDGSKNTTKGVRINNEIAFLTLAEPVPSGTVLCLGQLRTFLGNRSDENYSFMTSTIQPALASVAASNQSLSCEEKEKSLDLLVEDYTRAAAMNSNVQTGEIYKQILGLLNQPDSSFECQDALELKYTVDSIDYLNRFAHEIQKTDPRYVGAYDQSGSPFRYAELVSKIITSLHSKGKFIFLSKDFRNSAKGSWSQVAQGSEDYLAMGGYDCEHSLVMVDPNQRPFDLVTSVFHELDHLVRDKLTHPEDSAFYQNGAIDWSAYNLYDEFSAIALSAGAQADAQGVRKTPRDYDHYFISKKNHTGFSLTGDFTEFSPSGPFMDFFLSFDSDYKYMNTWYALDFLEDQAIKQDSTSKQWKKTNEDRQVILDRIRESYFPNISTVSLNLPKKNQVTLLDLLSNGPPFDDLMRVSPNDQKIRNFLANTATPSPMCRLYQAEILKDGVKGYLGKEFVSPTDQGTTGPSVVRPCLRIHNGL